MFHFTSWSREQMFAHRNREKLVLAHLNTMYIAFKEQWDMGT